MCSDPVVLGAPQVFVAISFVSVGTGPGITRAAECATVTDPYPAPQDRVGVAGSKQNMRVWVVSVIALGGTRGPNKDQGLQSCSALASALDSDGIRRDRIWRVTSKVRVIRKRPALQHISCPVSVYLAEFAKYLAVYGVSADSQSNWRIVSDHGGSVRGKCSEGVKWQLHAYARCRGTLPM